ncbi:MAG: hypothetical protein PHC34_09800 [Candidatus Gastranaerophilales bacterium]|nr:hypothetical protein [Candidatus Gastranaerophilales bacterium]
MISKLTVEEIISRSIRKPGDPPANIPVNPLAELDIYYANRGSQKMSQLNYDVVVIGGEEKSLPTSNIGKISTVTP